MSEDDDVDEVAEARKLLEAADVFFGPDEDDPKWAQMLNMNDVWGWACADGEQVEDGELVEVARLFKAYGWGGLLYWVSEKRNGSRSEFADNNRFIDFVRHEEQARRDFPDSNKRAYAKITYTLGEAAK